MSASNDPLVRWIALGTPAVLSIVFLSLGAVFLSIERRQTTVYRAVEGEITRSEVARGNTGTTASETTTWTHDFEYRYEVDGETYTGDRTASATYRTSDRSEVEETAARYPVGSKITVHYDPDDPATSVLEPGISALPSLFLALGVVGLLALAGVFFLLRRSPRERAALPGE